MSMRVGDYESESKSEDNVADHLDGGGSFCLVSFTVSSSTTSPQFAPLPCIRSCRQRHGPNASLIGSVSLSLSCLPSLPGCLV